jgi:hypothetical protein
MPAASGGALAEPARDLVCYDFDQDTTLPAIAEMRDKPPGVRLVRTISVAPPRCCERDSPPRKATIVTTMADLRSARADPRDGGRRCVDEGAAVAAGSR